MHRKLCIYLGNFIIDLKKTLFWDLGAYRKFTIIQTQFKHNIMALEEQGRMYGYEITQKVKKLPKELNITEGALYPALHKLEASLLDVEVEK